MPKPTTHTDIVVVTKQDPKNPQPVTTESVQVMLVCDAADRATIYAEKSDYAESAGATVSSPVVLEMDVNGESLKLGYELKTKLGSPTEPITGVVTNEPWGDTTSAPSVAKIGAAHRWASSNPEAFIAQLDLVLHGATTPNHMLSQSIVHSSTSGMKQATVVIMLDSRQVATLFLIVSMEASPV